LRTPASNLALALAAVLIAPAVPGWAGSVDGGSATATDTVAVGPGSTASANGGTAVGVSSTASGAANTAIGYSSTASAGFGAATAVGAGSTASAANSTVIGAGSVASGFAATVSGSFSLAIGAYSTTGGNGSAAAGFASLASGAFSLASGNGDIALGGQASTLNVSGQTTGNIAIGASTGSAGAIPVLGGTPALGGTPTTANGGNSIAIGTGAQSTGNNSVALGAGSDDGGQANVVSVGSSGAERKILHVANGSIAANSTDAVNGSQLYGVQQAAYAYTDAQLKAADDRANRGIASAVALSGAIPRFGATGNSLAVGVGSYGGQSALALQYARRFDFNDRTPMIASMGAASATGGGTAVHGSLSFGW
jgi:autotransporter adhesin